MVEDEKIGFVLHGLDNGNGGDCCELDPTTGNFVPLPWWDVDAVILNNILELAEQTPPLANYFTI